MNSDSGHGRYHCRRRTLQGGQSTFEYTVACAAIAFTLGLGMLDSSGPLYDLLQRLRDAYERYAFAMSLPG
jgi:hypothetical protein